MRRPEDASFYLAQSSIAASSFERGITNWFVNVLSEHSSKIEGIIMPEELRLDIIVESCFIHHGFNRHKEAYEMLQPLIPRHRIPQDAASWRRKCLAAALKLLLVTNHNQSQLRWSALVKFVLSEQYRLGLISELVNTCEYLLSTPGLDSKGRSTVLLFMGLAHARVHKPIKQSSNLG